MCPLTSIPVLFAAVHDGGEEHHASYRSTHPWMRPPASVYFTAFLSPVDKQPTSLAWAAIQLIQADLRTTKRVEPEQDAEKVTCLAMFGPAEA